MRSIGAVFAVLAAAAPLSAAPHSSAKTQRGEALIDSLSAQAARETNAEMRASIDRSLHEVKAALENNRRLPVPRRVDVLQLPVIHYRYVSASVGLGERPASNLPPANEGHDLSRLDPLPSTFWSRPARIDAQNLRTGFDRSATPRFEDQLWTYADPKTSYGGHAGFEARSGSDRVKIKFGEIHSEPFAARIFHALGYHVDPTDYSPGLKVKYDRRLLTEFNSRRPVDTRITALGLLPVWTIHFQPRHDPFEFIAAAVMKDGSRRTPEQLRVALLGESERRGETLEGSASFDGANQSTDGRFNAGFEAQINYLVTVPVNVQRKDPDEKSIGPWDFGQLGHEQLRELRGAGLLAAWLGWFDSRFDNTRLRVVTKGGRTELKHAFTDLGGGLGSGQGWSGGSAKMPDEFADAFTRPEFRQGQGRMTIPFRIINFRPIEPTPAFREMTLDDARWMARLIAQLTERQIVDALRASAFDEAEADAYRRKLLSRRDQMCRDLFGATNSVSVR